jgi:putative SOS response-associated peptidase YedK
MCGRYSLEDAAKIDSKMRGLIDHELVARIKNNYNVAPTQIMPVVVMSEKGKQLELMHWGIPSMLGKDTVKEIINTRADKAFERFWGNTVLRRRCLIPASGFYEWKTLPDGKHPFYIHPKDRELFAFAGIWSEWTDKEGKKFNTYSIMTTEPNKEMRDIHTRMPVILHEEDYDAWLTNTDERGNIEPLLRPYEDNGLDMYEVSLDVNNVRNNSKELIKAIA